MQQAKEYTIKRVSQKPPNEWQGPHGLVYYIRVQLSGHDKFVDIGKKRPDALKPGDTVYGFIEPGNSDVSDRFKSMKRPEQNAHQASSRDESSIRAQLAIKVAASFLQGTTTDFKELEDAAGEIYAMIDRVKDGNKPRKMSGYEVAKMTADSLRQAPDPEQVPIEAYDDDDETPINPNDIPF